MNKKYDYWFETEYPFAEFLQKVFGEQYKRKYSLNGNGIFNLLFIGNKIYEIKYTQAKAMLQSDNHKFTDDKEYIINTIVNNLKTDKYIINGGKFITFPIADWIAKVEVVKKQAIPQ